MNRVELKAVDPPPSIQEAMEKQMRAERDRRAVILIAEGEKQSQILTAEGHRQSQILTAEGDRQGAVLRADGERESRILIAQGEAEATRQTFQAIHDGRPTADLLTYQYIEALPKLADGQGMTLMLVPAEAIGAMGTFTALGSALKAGGDAAAVDAPSRSSS